MKRIIISLLTLTVFSTTYAEKLTESKFNEKYQSYKLEQAKDQAKITLLKADTSSVGTSESIKLTCKLWDAKIDMYNTALENKHIPDVGRLANNLYHEIYPYQLALMNMSGKTYEQYCEPYRAVAKLSGSN